MNERSKFFLRSCGFCIGGILLAASAYGAGNESSASQPPPAYPRAAELPPCPLAVPCRADESNSASISNAARPLSQGHLPPCPMSVPCMVGDGQRINLPRANTQTPPKLMRRLLVKVTRQDDADGRAANPSPPASAQQEISTQGRSAVTEQSLPPAPAPSAKAAVSSPVPIVASSVPLTAPRVVKAEPPASVQPAPAAASSALPHVEAT